MSINCKNNQLRAPGEDNPIRKRLEEAEQRKLQYIQQKAENSRKKNEEWKKKIQKIKSMEKLRLSEAENSMAKDDQIASSSSCNILGKLTKRLFGKTVPETRSEPSGGMSGSQSQEPPISEEKNPHLDQSMELSTFDITAYEEYDEKLTHRRNKSIPSWASNRETLKAAVFSMILLPDYEDKLPSGFPKPNKTCKLFPNAKKK